MSFESHSKRKRKMAFGVSRIVAWMGLYQDTKNKKKKKKKKKKRTIISKC
jgi:hypothetical protein